MGGPPAPSGRSRFWWNLAAVLGISLAGLVMAQRKLMYIPMKSGIVKPEYVQDVFFKNADNLKIHGWLYFAENAQRTVLMFHGNAGDVGGRKGIFDIWEYYKIPANLLLIDYRGFGQSESNGMSETGFTTDGTAAIQFLNDELQIHDIILYGRSLGGAVAMSVYEANANKVSGLILENTFTSMVDMAADVFPILGPFIRIPGIIWDTWRSDNRITKMDNTPVLFVSAERDNLVPPQQMKILSDTCTSSNKAWFTVEGRGHDDTWASHKLMATEFSNFIRSCGTMSNEES